MENPFQKIEAIEARYEALGREMASPEAAGNPSVYRGLATELAGITKIVETYRGYKAVLADLKAAKDLLDDADPGMREMAREEIAGLESRRGDLEQSLRVLLIPRDPNDEKNILLEIRSGAGGDEAALFAGDLLRMYLRYAEDRRWKAEILSRSETGVGGIKEATVLISGQNVYSRLKYESGVHRVQRVPTTESAGRIHTSTVTVAVLPEAQDVEVEINDNDLQIDVYRSSGPGGQSVNTTDSAVRITHKPSGIVVSCQDEKSQHKNKARGMKILRSRLLELEQRKQHAEISATRRSQVGTGDRSERIRTYNFQQGRVTDHRIGLTLHKIDRILEGELDDLIDPLIAHFQAEAMREAS
ncbi:MAG: peptide chain release factor 1 [Myxococcota bacterium]